MRIVYKPQPAKVNGVLRPIYMIPEVAGWQYVSFAVYQLRQGQTLEGAAHGEETALVILSGRGKAILDGQDLGEIGERLSVFEEKAPYTLYLSVRSSYAIRCDTETMEIALASAPTTGHHVPSRLLRPEDVSIEVRGEGQTLRRIKHILDTDQEAERLLIVEAVTPAGNWSSFPPHKHDTENPPHESYLEETYYHHIQPTNGFALQRVYVPGEFDETVAAYDGDLVLVPKGYHMVGAVPGCESYYLNVMAGSRRLWNYQVDPDFRRLLPSSGKITGSFTK